MNDFFKPETFVWVFLICVGLLCGTASSIAASRKNRSSFWAFIGFTFPWAILFLEILPTKKPNWLPDAANAPRLIKCSVCHGNMSSAAESCPHCGNKNPQNVSEKMGLIEKIGILSGLSYIIFCGFLFYHGNIYSIFRMEKFPQCNSAEAEHLAEKTFKNIPLFKMAGTEIIVWKSVSTSEDDREKRSCKAKVLLNTSEEIYILYDFHTEDGKLIITIRPSLDGLRN